MKPFQTLNYFELLEVPHSATAEEIAAAHQRQQELYAPDSVALYVLEDPSQAEELRKLLTEAMEILTDEDLRAEYHQQLGLPPPSEYVARRPAPVPAPEAGPAERLQALVGVEPPPAGAAPTAPLQSAAAPEEAREQPPVASGEPVGGPPGAVVSVEALTPAASAGPEGAPEAVEPPAPPAVVPPPLPVRSARPAPLLEELPRPPEESSIPGVEGVSAPVVRPREGRISRVEVSPDAEFNGELLRRIREGRGLSLQQLADRTRISSRHLESIEADRYKVLPATVYLRGMLTSIAKELGLDGARVARSYMDLVARSSRPPAL